MIRLTFLVAGIPRDLRVFAGEEADSVHASTRSKTLTASVTTKVTPAEKKRLVALAEEAGLSSSEWCRDVILNALETPPETQLLLSEFLALRTLVLALHSEVLLGKPLTEQRIATVIQQAEARKYAMAEARIRAFRSVSDPGGKEPAA